MNSLSMHLHLITRPDHPQLSFIQQLYESTFPVEERRDWQQVLKLLHEPAMQLQSICIGSEPAGFVCGWTIGNWYYIEHLAIDPKYRGKNYGAQIMKLLQGIHQQIILEVEPVHSSDSLRRIAFYERLGFSFVNIKYAQPPYRPDESAIPMLLMSMPGIKNETQAHGIAANIRACVYEKFYNY